MALTKDEAVVLRRQDYSETSQVLVFFTRANGKVRAIAKGVKRSTKTRFAVGIDLLDAGHLVFSTRTPQPSTLATVTEWKQTRAFLGLRERLDRLHAAQYAADIVAGLTEDWDPHPVLYDRFVERLGRLCETTSVLPDLIEFQRVVLREIGSLPELDRCVSCGRRPAPREPVHFSSFQGGLICRDCEPAEIEKRMIDPESLAVLRGNSEAAAAVPAAFETFTYHLAHLMGRSPASASWLSGRRARGAKP